MELSHVIGAVFGLVYAIDGWRKPTLDDAPLYKRPRIVGLLFLLTGTALSSLSDRFGADDNGAFVQGYGLGVVVAALLVLLIMSLLRFVETLSLIHREDPRDLGILALIGPAVRVPLEAFLHGWPQAKVELDIITAQLATTKNEFETSALKNLQSSFAIEREQLREQIDVLELKNTEQKKLSQESIEFLIALSDALSSAAARSFEELHSVLTFSDMKKEELSMETVHESIVGLRNARLNTLVVLELSLERALNLLVGSLPGNRDEKRACIYFGDKASKRLYFLAGTNQAHRRYHHSKASLMRAGSLAGHSITQPNIVIEYPRDRDAPFERKENSAYVSVAVIATDPLSGTASWDAVLCVDSKLQSATGNSDAVEDRLQEFVQVLDDILRALQFSWAEMQFWLSEKHLKRLE